MYAHGDLNQQAVAELRSALAEDPERPDLQVLLANLYWRMAQRKEAGDVAKAILEKLPYCRDANRLMAASLQSADKIEEAAAYHRRLVALDPYAAFVESAMVDPSTVDPSTVRLDKLAWRPGQSLSPLEAGRPEWAASLGAELKGEPASAPAVNLPSWLESQPVQQQPARPVSPPPTPQAAVQPFEGATVPPDEPIPDWMADAGWQPSTGEAVEGHVSFSDEELAGVTPPAGEEGAAESADELAPAEMPGWLQDITPPSESEDVASSDEFSPGWMQALETMGAVAAGAAVAASREPNSEPETPPEADLEPIAEGEGAGPADTEGEGTELPTWLDDMAPGATETIVYWLGDKDRASLEAEGIETPPAADAQSLEAPDWLEEAAASEVEVEGTEPEPEAPPEAIPGWLSGVADAAVQGPEPQPAAELPEWAAEAEDADESRLEDELQEARMAPEEAPDWLRSIAGAPEAEDAEAVPESVADISDVTASWLEEGPSEDSEEDLTPGQAPDWLARLSVPEESAQPEEAEGLTPLGAAAAGAAAGWLAGVLDSEPEEQEPTSPEPEPAADWLEGTEGVEAEEGELPVAEGAGDDWLRSLVPEQEPTSPEEAPFELEQPEWLERLSGSGGSEPPSGAQEPPDWLRAMAGAEPEPASPAEDDTLSPDWLERVLQAEPDSAEPSPIDFEAAEDDGLDIERPPWLAEQEPGWEETPIEEAPEAPIAQAAIPSPGQSDTPDWLQEFADAAGDETLPPAPPTTPPPAPPPPDLQFEGALDWLREGETGPMRAGGEDLERPPAPPSMEPEPLPYAAGVARTPAGDVEDEEIFRWLEDLAQRQEGDAVPSGIVPRSDVFPEAPQPAVPEASQVPEEPDSGMEWLEQLAEPEPLAAAEPAYVSPEPIAPPSAAEPEVAPPEPAAPPGAAAPELEIEMAAEFPEPERIEPELPVPSPAAPEAEEEDITEWLKALSQATPAEAPVQAPPPEIPAAVEAPPPTPVQQVAPAPAEPILPPVPEPAPPPAPPTWTPVEEAWVAQAPQPVPPAEPPAPPPMAAAPSLPPAPVVEPAAPVPAPAGPEPEAPRPEKPVKPKTAGAAEVLQRARQGLAQGDFKKAAKDYGTVIRKRHELDQVINDLRVAADHFPSEATLWQLLGDAYMRADRAEEAVEAYNRGMKAA